MSVRACTVSVRACTVSVRACTVSPAAGTREEALMSAPDMPRLSRASLPRAECTGDCLQGLEGQCMRTPRRDQLPSHRFALMPCRAMARHAACVVVLPLLPPVFSRLPPSLPYAPPAPLEGSSGGWYAQSCR